MKKYSIQTKMFPGIERRINSWQSNTTNVLLLSSVPWIFEWQPTLSILLRSKITCVCSLFLLFLNQSRTRLGLLELDYNSHRLELKSPFVGQDRKKEILDFYDSIKACDGRLAPFKVFMVSRFK